MKNFRFKEEWEKHNKSFGIVVLLAYLMGLFVYNYIKSNTNGNGKNFDLSIILTIVFVTIILTTTIVAITYIIIFTINSKTIDVNEMFPKINQCSIFNNIDNLSLSSKEDILKWYNIVEYSEIEQIERQLDPAEIHGKEHVWLVTSDLTLELENEDLISTISSNIEKGIKYTYFLPDDEIIRLEIEKLNNIYGSQKIKTVLLNKKCRLIFQLFDVIIFDPINNYNHTFICVDFSEPRKYRKLTTDDAQNLITKLNKEKQSSQREV